MAILMRGGVYDDFIPSKLLPREFAVVLNSDPGTADGKAIYICFGTGKVKRISTFEDMRHDIEQVSDELFAQYIATFNEILQQMQALEQQTSAYKTEVESIRSDIVNVYLPQIVDAYNNALKAKESADAAENFNKLSESFAHGKVGVREGEDTDNSEYYSKQSKQSSEISKEYLTKVEQAGDEAVEKINQALDMDVPEFMVDITTGNLLYEGGRFVFSVNRSNGNLEWEVAV